MSKLASNKPIDARKKILNTYIAGGVKNGLKSGLKLIKMTYGLR